MMRLYWGRIHENEIVVGTVGGKPWTMTQKWRAWGISFGRTLFGMMRMWREN